MLVTALICQSDGATTHGTHAYLQHFHALAALGLPIVLFLDRSLLGTVNLPHVRVVPLSLSDLRLARQLAGKEALLPATRNRHKDHQDYLIVVNSKTELIMRAAQLYPDCPRFSWIDCGIAHVFKQPSQTLAHLHHCDQLAPGLTLPTLWSAPQHTTDTVCWRFAGGFFSLDRASCEVFDHLVWTALVALLPRLTWDVNVWAMLESEGKLGGSAGLRMHSYPADHNDSMLHFPVPPEAPLSAPPAFASPRLCLNMIVRNEAAIIERVLASVQGYVSYCVICDTGSTDDTVERIHALCKRFGMACEVHQIPFLNFSQARNEALARARQSPMAFDYLLLCDADMALQVDDEQAFRQLDADALSMRQESKALAYHNIRVLRRYADAHYVGATHEALVVNGRTGTLPGAWFIDHADGGTRSEKLERDERLLKASLSAQPDDSRAMFYLAQTLFDAGRFAEAAIWYQKRWKAGGWAEERWYALYKRAVCLQQLDDEARFISFNLQAYNERPHRAEPLVSVAKHLAASGQHDAALMYLEQAQQIRLPVDDVLFVEKEAYGVAVRELISISGFYSQRSERRQSGQQACEQLSIDPQLSLPRRQLARSNLSYYAPALESLCGRFTQHRLNFAAPEGFVLTNPSVARDKDRYRCVVRAVNYRLEAGRYHIHDPRQVVRTRNFMLTLDAQFCVESVTEMQDHSALPRWENNPIRGFEDCRLFRWQDHWWCSATARDVSADSRAIMVLMQLDDANHISQAFMLRGYGDHLHQKNWMPVAGERLQFIYSCGPAFLLDASRADGSFVVEHGTQPGIACEHWRGGAALPWPGGFLALIHEAVDLGAERCYLHRFVQLSPEGIPQSASIAFHLQHRGIEFVAGLSYGLDNTELVISFGVRDREAWLGKVSTAAVQALLRPLPSSQPAPFPGYTPTP